MLKTSILQILQIILENNLITVCIRSKNNSFFLKTDPTMLICPLAVAFFRFKFSVRNTMRKEQYAFSDNTRKQSAKILSI